jgi:sulfopyruvate decarboxylase TPP-binding subunit
MIPGFGERLAAALEGAGVTVAASLPDDWLEPAIARLAASETIRHAAAAREEDALAICMGAALSGRRAACLMQNAGLLNTGGTLATLGNAFGTPLVLIVADRGRLGDVGTSHFEKALFSRPFLTALKIPHFDLAADFAATGQIEQAFVMAEAGQCPLALLVTAESLKEKP